VLARVEKKLAGEPFLVIGVHSPKFPNERDEKMVREAVRRFGVTHPVVIDSGRRIWEQYTVRSWPTLVVVDPLGNIFGAAPGEPDEEPLETLIGQLLEACREQGIPLSTAELPLRPEPSPKGRLSYPGKVVATPDRLFVADTGHHQIVEVELSADGPAVEKRRFGSGQPAFADGGKDAAFSHPNGLAFDEGSGALWVADTGNHAIRRIALDTGEVSTTAGTGEKGRSIPASADTPGRQLALRSPWDLAFDPGTFRLYVAMAGTHQIFVLDTVGGRIHVFAGSGREARVDGPTASAAFAQPSGLALSGGKLYVADSEISCVREIDLDRRQVRTVAGGDLFEFGDRDGTGDDVRLQHPIGIAASGETLLLADSFNHKIKEVDPASGRVRSLYGNGQALNVPFASQGDFFTLPAIAGTDKPIFFEPEGLSVAAGRLYVADTNNHRIVEIDLASDVTRLIVGK
jgi:DNA-binding beta-propeller fold protein YncE